MSSVLGAFRRNPRDGAIAALAIPALATLAMDPLVSIVDTAWVGRLGTAALAALAVASAVFAAVFSVFNFVYMTVTPLVAGEVGRGDLRRAGGITRGALLLSFGVGVAVALVGVVVSDPIVAAFGAEAEASGLAADYLRVRFLALPAMLVALVGHGVYRGHSDTRTPLYVALAMNTINLVLDPVLIFGAGLGVVGAAWATVAAQWLAAAAFVVLILGTQRTRLGTLGRVRGIRALRIGSLVAAGWPMMIRSAALLTAITATTVAAARIGTAEVAAHQIALQVWLFLAFVLDAYAVAGQAMVGTDIGSGNLGAARRIANRLLALGLLTGVGLSLLLAVTAPIVPALFSAEPAVSADLAAVYPFVIVLQPLTALVYVWDGIGIGASAFRYLAGSMVVACGLTIVTLVVAGGSLIGVWAGVTVLTVSRLVALAAWHRSGFASLVRGPSPASRGA